MKRWMTLAACALVAAACQDQLPDAREAADPAALLGVPAGAPLDPVLTAALNLAAATDRIEVIVNFDDSRVDVAVLTDRLLATGAGVIPFRHLPLAAVHATPAEIAVIRTLPGVTSLYANRQLRYMLRESVRSIRADRVHVDGVTGRGVGIAILDSGVDGLYHPGLQYPTKTVANVKHAGSMQDLVTWGSDRTVPKPAFSLFIDDVPNSETSVGHGTHVAGIAAGDGGGSTDGIYRGVAPGADVIGIGAGDVLWVFWALAGFDYLLEKREAHNIRVVNNSWGGAGAFDPEDPINRATKRVAEAGVAVVFAAGNEGPGENTLNPYGVAPWALGVAAGCKLYVEDPTDSAWSCRDAAGREPVLARFSSRGIPGDPVYRPHVTAPGVQIVSARASTGMVMNGLDLLDDATTCNVSLQHIDHYTCASGTSMAAPHVAGVIALMVEASGGRLGPDRMFRILQQTARPLPGYEAWEVGAGFVDAEAAVRVARRGK